MLAAALQNPNAQRYLRMLATAEGTLKGGRNPYQVGFGGSQIEDLSAHPNIRKAFKQTDGRTNYTTAAGAYQFIKPTWDSLQKRLGLTDFSPRSQDLGALELIRQNGALNDVLAGDYNTANKKLGKIWASLPTSTYAQPKRSQAFINNALGIKEARAEQVQQTGMKMRKQNAIDPNSIIWDDAPQQPRKQPAAKQQGIDPNSIVWDDVPQQPVVNQAKPQQQAIAQPQPAQQPAPKQQQQAKGTGNWWMDALVGTGRGATDVIETGVRGALKAKDYIFGGNSHDEWKAKFDNRKAQFDDQFQGNKTVSVARVGGQILATTPITGGLGKGMAALSKAAHFRPGVQFAHGIATGGMKAGGAKGLSGMAIRTAAGGINGGITAGLVNPEDAKKGAVIGALMPSAVKVVGKTANAITSLPRKIMGGGASKEVKELAQKAADLGIDIPADRLGGSKAMDAVARSLEYVPGSGRQKTLDAMQKQMNKAVARSMGQDTDNLILAYRTAKKELGGQFDDILQNNNVRLDETFKKALAKHMQDAEGELLDKSPAITRYIKRILGAAGKDGVIDGRAAYNIKRDLAEMAGRNSTYAKYADEIEKSLMGAVNRSLTPEKAASFATTRRNYANMKAIKNMIQNGAEGDLNIGALSRARDLRTPELQDLSDIAAQFVRPREGAHGGAQRVVQGILGTGAAVGGFWNPAFWTTLGTGAIGGRTLNAALNSNWAKRAVLNGAQPALTYAPTGGLLGSAAMLAPLLAANPSHAHSVQSRRRKQQRQ